MAGELAIRHSATGRTVQFLLWNAVSRVWDGSAFVPYATADLNSYRITAAEQGVASRRYVGDWPAGIPAGVYAVEAFDQAAGPAGSLTESDQFLGSETLSWTGTAVGPPALLAGCGLPAPPALAGNGMRSGAAPLAGAPGSAAGLSGGWKA